MNTAEKVQKKLYLLFIALILVTMLVPMVSAGIAAASDLPADSAVQFLYREYTLNGLHNADAGVGCYAFYILRQAGVDVSTWVYNGVCLKDAVWDTVYGDLQDSAGVSAKTLAQDLVAAQALGRNDLADRLLQVLKDRQTADGFDPGEWSIFANMPAFDLVSRAGLSSVVDTAYAKSYILGTQNTSVESVIYGTYGSWGCVWGGSFYPDFMTTAQAVRALYFLDPDKGDSSVQTAIYNGLEWMKGQQRADGSFASGWDDPVVDTAEAIVTLKLLGIDPVAWRSSEGKSPVDYLATGALNPDGSFGTSKNAMDATWMLSACNALGVEPTVLRFYLDPAGATLNTGDKTRFKAVWRDIYGQEMDVTGWAEWSVEDNGIASVDNDENKGLVTALSAGQTVVRAVYGEGAASAVLTVKPPAGNGGGQTAVNAGLAVVGKDGELLYGPAYISVAENNRWGLTALGILDASGLSYHTSNWDWGVMVDAICGQANSGMAGWMYAVNGEMPMCGPEKYLIKTG
ncbi:MAG: Ig-like domain-containing protein, partial [Bacillota bacterium]